MSRSNSVHDGFFDKVGQLFDRKTALGEILCPGATEFAVDDQLDGHGAADAGLRRGGDGFVVGVCVQGIAVIIDRVQRLQGGADIVEVDLLGMEAPAAGLDMVFELLGAAVAFIDVLIAFAQMRLATRPMTLYSGSIPLLKKKERLGAKSSRAMPRLR